MPGVEISPVEAGTEAGGYRVSGNPGTTLRISVWGYWSPDVTAAFSREAPGACRDLAPDAVFALDAHDLKPQGAEGQEALRVLFRALAPLTFEKAVVRARHPLARMQITRLMRECGLDGRLVFGES